MNLRNYFMAVTAASLLALGSNTHAAEDVSQPIIGGATTPNDGTRPGALAVRLDSPLGCSATLLTDRWVLTGTHCLPLTPAADRDPPEVNPASVSMRAFRSGVGRIADRIVRHPSIYDLWPRNQGVDVVLVRATGPFNVTDPSGQPLNLDGNNAVDAQCGESGFGTLRQASLTVSSVDDTSDTSLRGHLRLMSFSPGTTGEQKAHGDSGSGSFLSQGGSWQIAGVYSSGNACATPPSA